MGFFARSALVVPSSRSNGMTLTVNRSCFCTEGPECLTTCGVPNASTAAPVPGPITFDQRGVGRSTCSDGRFGLGRLFDLSGRVRIFAGP